MTDMFDAKSASPMLAGESREAFDSPDFIYELHLDGERCIAYLDPLLDSTVLRNKRGADMLPKVPELGRIHKRVDARCILDGELIVAVNGEPNGYEILRRSQTKDHYQIYLQSSLAPATFVASDILYHVNHEVTSWTLTQRKELLERLVTEDERIVVSRYVEEHGIDQFNLATKRNLNEIVAKRKESRYYPGKNSKDWIQCRNPQDDDFVVCGYTPKEDHTASIVLGQYEGDRLTYKGHVTLGVSARDIQVMEAHPRAESVPLDSVANEIGTAVWLKPSLVCTVRDMEMVQTGFTRQPVFKGFRVDMTARECAAKHALAAPS
jgi:ATP-dependent DNA ligase